jgi:hypothetical protein
VAPEAQLEWEARAGRPAAAAAFGSAIVGIAGLVVAAASGLFAPVDDSVEEAVRNHLHPGAFVASSVLQGISVALIAPVLVYLYRATRYRRPETPRAAYYLGLIGPVATGIFVIANAVARLGVADRVYPKLPLPPKQAIHLVDHELTKGTAAALGYISILAAFALVGGVVLNNLNARRAGLISQFLNVIGIIAAVLLIIPALGIPIVQFFWLGALGALFLNRWPQGRGPAWESGEAIPWPTAAELREQQQAESGKGGDGRPSDRGALKRVEERARERAARAQAEAAARDDGSDAGDDEAEATAAGAQHPRSKKRKRKRRR